MSCFYEDHWYDAFWVHLVGIMLGISLLAGAAGWLAWWAQEQDHKSQLAHAENCQDLKDAQCEVCGSRQMKLMYLTWSPQAGCRLFQARCERCDHFWYIRIPSKAEHE